MQPIADYSIPANARIQSVAVPGSLGLSTGKLNSSSASMQYPSTGTVTGSPGNSTCSTATGTSSTTGARNPFAAMPRELRNSQLRSNLLAVAGAFTACSASSSPPSSGNRLMQAQQQVQQLQWQPSAMAAATPGAGAGVAQPPPPPPPAQHPRPAVTSSAVYGPCAAMLTTSGPLPLGFAPQGAPHYAAASSAMLTHAAAVSSYTCPLPLPLQQQQHAGAASCCADGSYMQQQQVLLVSRPQQPQFAGQHMCMYSDPLPYSASGSIAPAQPAMQMHPQPQLVSQEFRADMPCTMLTVEQQPVMMHHVAIVPARQLHQQQPPPPPPRSGVRPSGAVQVGGGDYSQVQQLLQKQQALQAMEQMVQQQLLRLLPDA